MKIVLMIWLLIPAIGLAVGAAPDCQSGGRYLALARDKQASSDFADAADQAQHAVEACPSYDAYELLGELRARSLQRAEQVHAVDAFIAADELAPTDQLRARSLYQYARLLNLDGDPQNAYPLIRDAKSLDPDNADIAALARQLEQRINNPTKEQIVRGLWNSIYKPLRVARAGAPHPSPAPAVSAKPSVNIPINFEFGTTIVDGQSRANIGVLASALAESTYSQQHFTFVGHADIRGSESTNVVLSKRRAKALSQAVIVLEPSLQGRIDVVGRGSSEPIDPGHDEAAYRANRRLQVLLQ